LSQKYVKIGTGVPPGNRPGYGRLTSWDLRGTYVIYDILYERRKYSCRRRSRIRVSAHSLSDHPAHERCPDQLVANPLNIVGILGIRIRLDNQVEIARGRITRRGGSASPASNRAD